MSDKKYTEEELYQLLMEKAKEIEKVPGVREINNDPRLPNYEMFKECFGNFRKSDKLKDLVQEFSLLNKMNGCYCLDCPREQENCKLNSLTCKSKYTEEELKPYFELFDTIVF